METQQTTEAAPAAAAPIEGNPEVSLDERAASLLDSLKSEGPAPSEEPAADEPAIAAKIAKPADAPVVEAAVAKTPEQIAEERRQRIAARDADIQKLAENERARVAASRQRKQERQPAEASPPAAPAGLAVTDVASFWKAAEALNVPPGEMAAWLSGQSDPVATAKHAAKEALTPVEKKLAELEAKQAQWEQQQREAQQAAHTAQLVQQNFQILGQHLDSVKAEAPLAASLKAKRPELFEQAVHSICDGLPPGFTAQDVVDQLEENLAALQLVSAAEPPTSTQQRTAKPAAAKANVGNRLASERATTVEDDDTDVAPDLEDRARQLKARLAAG